MLPEKNSSFLTAGWTEIETLTGERPHYFVSALGICTLYSCDAFGVISACYETFSEVLNSFKTDSALFCIVLFAVF